MWTMAGVVVLMILAAVIAGFAAVIFRLTEDPEPPDGR